MKNLPNNPHRSGGFTLIELLVVIGLIAILSGITLSVVNVTGVRQKSRDAQRAGDVKRIQTALELYFADRRTYPVAGWTRITGSDAVSNALTTGNYISAVPADPTQTATGNGCTAAAGYMYDSTGGAYVITAHMEVSTSANPSLCSSLRNCTSGTIPNCNCGAPCYGVQNPF